MTNESRLHGRTWGEWEDYFSEPLADLIRDEGARRQIGNDVLKHVSRAFISGFEKDNREGRARTFTDAAARAHDDVSLLIDLATRGGSFDMSAKVIGMTTVNDLKAFRERLADLARRTALYAEQAKQEISTPKRGPRTTRAKDMADAIVRIFLSRIGRQSLETGFRFGKYSRDRVALRANPPASAFDHVMDRIEEYLELRGLPLRVSHPVRRAAIKRALDVRVSAGSDET